jgi:hypothetical protein
MKQNIFFGLLTVIVLAGCSGDQSASGITDDSSTSPSGTAETNQCTSPTTQVIDYGFRRTLGAALNVRGAFSDVKLIPDTNYPAVVFNETNSTAGVSLLKYQYWDGDEFKIETISGGITHTYVKLVFLDSGRPLVFWGNGAAVLYMAARSTASYTTEGTWTVTQLDGTSTAIRAIEAAVSPSDQVIVSFATHTTSAPMKAYICSSNCHLSANYTAVSGNLDSTAGLGMTTHGVGWCNSGSAYYPMVLYSDTAAATLIMCRDTLANCATGTNWATNVTLTNSGANVFGTQLYSDATAADSTVYMVVKHSGGLRPYTYATCASNVSATAADPGTNYVSATATVGLSYFNLGYGDGTFHVVANDGQTMLKYFNQPTASFDTTTWRASATPHVETTAALGIAGTGSTRGGVAIDTTGDQVLVSYGRTLAVTPTQTFGNVVLAYNDCPSGLGSPACSSTTLASDASSTYMTWGNMPLDGTGQVGRNSLQVPSISTAVTSDGHPAAAYIDFSVGLSAEPVLGALLKYSYRSGSTASSKWAYSVVPTTSAPQSPSLAFDHNDTPWISWYETVTGSPGGFRYYLANNSRTDGQGLWTTYAYPLSDASAPTLPAMNMTALAMQYSGGVAKPVMVVLRNPTLSKGVHAARFNPATNQWDYQQKILAFNGSATPGGAWLAADYDTSGNISVAVHDLGTSTGATCSPTTTRCIRTTYSTDGGSTWATTGAGLSGGQIYSGTAEGLDIKLNPSTSRPAVSFYNRSLNVARYKYCSSALASCTSSSNWADVDTGVIDALAGINNMVDTTNIGLLNTSLTFNSAGYPSVVWSRGQSAVVNANLMYTGITSSGGSFSTPSTLKAGAFGNEVNTPVANAGNFALNWNAKSARSTETGSLHTVHIGPGNFLYATSCGD